MIIVLRLIKLLNLEIGTDPRLMKVSNNDILFIYWVEGNEENNYF